MKRKYFLSIVLAFCLTALFAKDGECGLVLTAGESYSLEFTSLQFSKYLSENDNIFALAQVSVSPVTSDVSTYRFSIYEDSLLDSPMRTGVAGVNPNFGGGQGLGFFDYAYNPPWHDMQGVFYIEVLTSSLELESFIGATVINSALYQQTFTVVPLPSSLVIFLSGALMLGIFGYITKNAKRLDYI